MLTNRSVRMGGRLDLITTDMLHASRENAHMICRTSYEADVTSSPGILDDDGSGLLAYETLAYTSNETYLQPNTAEKPDPN